MARWLVVVCALAGCLPPSDRDCGNGIVCPLDRVCTGDGRCALPEEVAACDGRAPGDACTVGVAQGTCTGGACVLPACGDGVANGGEACDGADLAGRTCKLLGFYDDTTALACGDFCRFDASRCSGFCGDGARNGPEVCEGADLGAKTCLDFGFDRGHLGCTASCGPDLSGCRYIGWQPLPVGAPGALYGAWGSSANDIFIVGAIGTIRHFDGSTWSTMSSGTTADLEAIWGSGPSDVFAGGIDVVLHYDGTGWTPNPIAGAGRIHAVWGTGPADVYALGVSAYHYDGLAWTMLPLATSAADYSRTGLLGYKTVWGSAASDVYVFEGQGAATPPRVSHYDGTSWGSGGFSDKPAQWCWGTSADDVFVVGEQWITHWDGMSPSTIAAPNVGFPLLPRLYGVWGSGPSDVFAVGSQGRVFHFDGQEWSNFPFAAQSNLWNVWGTAPDNVIAVGQLGTALRYPGAVWKPITSGTTWPMFDVSGVSTTEVYATIRNLFASQLFHCDEFGCSIVDMTDGGGQPVGVAKAIWENSPTDIFVGTSANVAHNDGGYWTVIGAPPVIPRDIEDLWSPGPNEVYAVGIDGNGDGWSIVHYVGATWTTVMSSSTHLDFMRSIWGSGPGDIFAVGNTADGAPILVHYDGTSWTPMQNPSSQGLWSVWGRGSNDVYAVGDGGAILHYDGSTWSAMASGTTTSLRAVWVRGPNDVFAVGQGGLILHLDAIGWSRIRSNTTSTLNAVWGYGGTTFLSGDNGTFLELVQTVPL